MGALGGPFLFVGLGSQEQVSGTGAQSKPAAQPNRLLWLRLEMGHNMPPVGPIAGREWANSLGPPPHGSWTKKQKLVPVILTRSCPKTMNASRLGCMRQVPMAICC